MASGTRTRCRDSERVSGRTEGSTRENFSTIKCTVVVFLRGMMVGYIQGSTRTIINTASVSSPGLTAAASKASGLTANDSD